ncbi:unnamed protein product [Merluccius merluccius]
MGIEDAMEEGKEQGMEKQKDFSVISPKEAKVRKWNISLTLLSLLSVSVSFFELFFDSTIGVVHAIRYGLDVVFLINIISRFYIGYEYNGVVINAQLVRRNYLKTWFLIDTLGVIPLELFRFVYPECHFLHFTRCFRVFRMFDTISSLQKDPYMNKIHVFLLNAFTVVIIILQLSAYLLLYLVCNPKYSDISANCTGGEENWIHLESKGKWCKSLFFKDAIYWSSMTLFSVGYGDLHATTVNEAKVTSVIMLIGVFAIVGYIIPDMSSLISNLDASKVKFFLRMESIRHHMKHMGLPEDVQTRLEIHYADVLFAKKWDDFVFWCITVSIFIHTWVLFFTNNEETTGFFKDGSGGVILSICSVIDIIAGIDIIICLRTEVATTDGYMSDMAGILKNYRASWNLQYDVLAVLPLDIFSLVAPAKFQWQLLCYLRLNRLIWLRKVYLFFKKRENYIKCNLLKQRAAKCMFLLILFVHCCAGFMYISGCGTNRCDQGSWAWNNGLESKKSNFYHYTLSAYWAMSTLTTVGYGDIIPGNTSDKFTAVAIAIIGSFVLNFIISHIYSTISSSSGPRVKFQHRLSVMKLAMESHRYLSASLQKRVVNYMSLLWSKYHGQSYPGGPSLIRDVPKDIQKLVLMNQRGELLSEIPFFEQAGLDFILDLATVSVMYFFPRGEIIQYREAISRELFCIKRGTCQILTDDLANIVGMYGEKMCFGEAGFLFAKKAPVTVRAETYCEILVIDFDKMMTILDKYPAIKGQMEELCSDSKYYSDLDEDMMNLKRSKAPGRFFRKSKCYFEDFGYFQYYAGAQEETFEEHLRRLNKKREKCSQPTNIPGRLAFFFRRFLSLFLMRRAILPSNAAYVCWEFFRTLLGVTVSVLGFLHFAFLHEKTEMWITCYVLGLFCWVDMYICLHVAFYKDGHLQVDTLETAKNYAKTSFLLDFISCFPWEVFGWLVVSPFNSTGFYGNTVALHLYALMRAPHVLQLYRLSQAFSYWQSGIATEKARITLFKFLIYFVLLLHISSCVIFASVCPPGDHIHTGNESNYMLPAMKHNCSKYSWVSHLEMHKKIDFETATFLQMYIVTLYFATATVCGVGYGDIFPHIPLMRTVVSFIMVSSALWGGFVASNMQAMFANADAPRVELTEKKESMKAFLKSHRITGRLYDTALNFYDFKWIKAKGTDPDTLFEQLPSSIQGDIAMIFYADIAHAVGLNIKADPPLETETLTPLERRLLSKINGPIFQRAVSKECVHQLEMDPGYIRLLATQIRPCLYMANDYICQKDDVGSEMYFIQKGEVEVLSSCENSVVTRFKAGQYFGEQSLLFEHLRAATIRAATDCNLYILSKKNLHRTLNNYPDVLEQIKRAAQRIREQEQVDQAQTSDADKLFKENKGCEHLRHLSNLQGLLVILFAPLDVRWKNYSGLLERLVKLYNFTINPENVLYQYTSCLLITLSFWAIIYMEVVYLTPVIFIFSMVILSLMYKEEQNLTTNLLHIRVIKFLVQFINFIHLGAVFWTCFWLVNGRDSWIGERDVEDFADVYIYSVYWALNTYTTTGFGDITATNMQEILFSILIMVLSKMHLCYSMGMLSATKANKGVLQMACEEKLQAIQKYMLDENIAMPLQNHVMHFYNHQWTRTRGVDSEALFKDIPHTIKSQIFSRMCITMLPKQKLFSHVSEAFIRNMATKMLMKSYIAGDYIIRRGDMGTGMHLILSGTVKLCSSNAGQESEVYLTTGAVLGSQQLIQQQRWGDMAIVDDYVDILFLSKEVFDQLGHHYPEDMRKCRQGY